MLTEKVLPTIGQELTSILHSRLFINQIIRFILDVPPNKESFQTILQDDRFQSLCEISTACKLIQTACNSLLSNHESLIRAQEEYNRLFIGPNILPAPLWESVYLGKEHILFEEPTLQVRACYRKHGLSYIHNKNEPDDHIVSELEFLSYLIQQTNESENLESTKYFLSEQLTFLDYHLLKWCPQFCEMLNESTPFTLYKGAALLLNEYINLERELVLELKGAIDHE